MIRENPSWNTLNGFGKIAKQQIHVFSFYATILGAEYWVVFLNLFVNSIKAEIESFQNVICNHMLDKIWGYSLFGSFGGPEKGRLFPVGC